MPYLHLQPTLSHLGDSPTCGCTGVRASVTSSFGEVSSSSEFSESERKMVASAIGEVLQSAARPSTHDVNRVSDRVFFARHPSRNGRLIDPRTEPNLAEEWRKIRDRLVLPIIEAKIAFKKGMEALDARQHKRAVSFFDRARRVSIAPVEDRARATHYLGVASFDLKRLAAAIGYSEVVRTFPGVSPVLRAQAEALFTLAKDEYRKAIP